MAADIPPKVPFTWLHLSDLHAGLAGQKHLYPNVQKTFFEDLASLVPAVGGCDLILFSGDLTQSGQPAEFAELDRMLDRLRERIAPLNHGREPILLPVPGNHDLMRPKPTRPDVRMVRKLWGEVRREFWETPSGDSASYHALVAEIFAPYSAWYRANKDRALQQGVLTTWNDGLLPGDFSVSLQRGGLRVCVVGLNSAFLQIGAPDDKGWHGDLDVSLPQLAAACGGGDRWLEWLGGHDITILMTHHPREWLNEAAQKEFMTEIAPPGRFTLHLFGHMHEPAGTETHPGFGPADRRLQGASLFGLEGWGTTAKRIHGYSAGRAERYSDALIRLTLWPRRMVFTSSGTRKIMPDHEYDGITSGKDQLVIDLKQDSVTGSDEVAPPLPTPAAVPRMPAPRPVAMVPVRAGAVKPQTETARRANLAYGVGGVLLGVAGLAAGAYGLSYLKTKPPEPRIDLCQDHLSPEECHSKVILETETWKTRYELAKQDAIIGNAERDRNRLMYEQLNKEYEQIKQEYAQMSAHVANIGRGIKNIETTPKEDLPRQYSELNRLVRSAQPKASSAVAMASPPGAVATVWQTSCTFSPPADVVIPGKRDDGGKSGQWGFDSYCPIVGTQARVEFRGKVRLEPQGKVARVYVCAGKPSDISYFTAPGCGDHWEEIKESGVSELHGQSAIVKVAGGKAVVAGFLLVRTCDQGTDEKNAFCSVRILKDSKLTITSLP